MLASVMGFIVTMSGLSDQFYRKIALIRYPDHRSPLNKVLLLSVIAATLHCM